MTISKTSIAAVVSLAACFSAGYAGREYTAAAANIPPNLVKVQTAGGPTFISGGLSGISTLRAEWQKLHDSYGSTAAAMPALHIAIAALQDPFRRRAFRSAQLAEWTEIDPAGALTFFGGKNDQDLSEQVVRKWMTRDADAAVRALMNSGAGWERVAHNLLGEIARRTPDLLARVAANLPPDKGIGEHSSVHNVFAVFARNDLSKARTAAESMSGENRDRALAGVAKAWGERDLQSALAWAGMLNGDARQDAIRSALVGLASVDPITALENLHLVPPGADDIHSANDADSRVLGAAASKDLSGTLAWMEKNPARFSDFGTNGLRSQIETRLLHAPFATLDLLQNTAPKSSRWLIENILLNETTSLSRDIRNWLAGQPQSEFTETVRDGLVSGLAWNSPSKLSQWVGEMSPEELTPARLEKISARLLNGGARMEVLDEILPSAAPALRDSLLRFAFLNARELPPGEMSLWRARFEQLPPADRREASPQFAAHWSAIDPNAAIVWAAALPDPEARVKSYGAIAERWSVSDSYAASEWVGALTKGPERDAAVRSLVAAVAESEPAAAMEWAHTIDNPALREGTLKLVAVLSKQALR